MYLLFDIGGTNMRLAFSKDGETFGEPKMIKTPKKFDEAIETFKKLADEVSGGGKIEMVGGGMKGPFNKEKTAIVNSPALPDWDNKPLKEELEKAIGAPVFIENDTAIVGLGEMHSGAGKVDGKSPEIGVYITVSTGVGGARFVDGKIDRSKFGFEPGHQIINIIDGNTSDGLGHLEEFISGSALRKQFNKEPYEVTDKEVWDKLAHYLAYGLYNTILHWSPDVVVLGGPMMVGDPSINTGDTIKYLNEIASVFPELPEIKEAELGDFGGLYGALAFLKQQKKLK
jgi:glucokinase